MKKLLAGLIVLTSMTTMAQSSLIGDYSLVSGDSSCEKNVSLISVEREVSGGLASGLSIVETSRVGTMFENEGAEDFLNLNGAEVEVNTRNSSHGTKYVSRSKSKEVKNSLSKTEVLKTYNSFFRTSKVNIQVSLTLIGKELSYKKILTGSSDWKRTCSYIKQ